jgi:alpha-tubulin suppressor-like RCC1 family protein
MGDGTSGPGTDHLVPSPVAGNLVFAEVSPGFAHTCGVTTSRTAYCWGYNGNGTLGDGTTIDRLVPTAVASP